MHFYTFFLSYETYFEIPGFISGINRNKTGLFCCSWTFVEKFTFIANPDIIQAYVSTFLVIQYHQTSHNVITRHHEDIDLTKNYERTTYIFVVSSEHCPE